MEILRHVTFKSLPPSLPEDSSVIARKNIPIQPSISSVNITSQVPVTNFTSKIHISVLFYFSYPVIKTSCEPEYLQWVFYAGINFMHNKPPGHDLKRAKTLPRDNHCVQKPSGTEQGAKSPTPGT